MFRRILQKELLHHLLDLRFIAVMTLCILLSLLSVYVGTRTYQKQKEEYSTAFERNRSHIENITQHRAGSGLYCPPAIPGTGGRRPSARSCTECLENWVRRSGSIINAC